MPRYTIEIDANMRGGRYLAAIHAANCRAIGREATAATRTETIVGTLREALDIAVDAEDRELGHDDSDAYIHPCADLPRSHLTSPGVRKLTDPEWMRTHARGECTTHDDPEPCYRHGGPA